MNVIIQWNIQGFKAKYEEYIELKKRDSAIICVQESMLGAATPACPRGYAFYAHLSTDQPGPG